MNKSVHTDNLLPTNELYWDFVPMNLGVNFVKIDPNISPLSWLFTHSQAKILFC